MEQLNVMPIRVRVTSVLRKALLSGEYKSGEELSLTDVSAQLGVSRTPVREAFQSLAAEGLLTLRMNKGAIVNGITEKYIRDHFEMREILESQAVKLAMERCSDFSELTALQQSMENSDIDDDFYRVYNQKFHTLIWTASGNDRLYDTLLSLWNGPSRKRDNGIHSHEKLSIAEHGQILQFILSGDQEKAANAMKQHIRRSRDNVLTDFANLA